jgi:hypothetical protein
MFPDNTEMYLQYPSQNIAMNTDEGAGDVGADFSGTSPTVAIVEAIAEHNGSDPTDPLGDGSNLYDCLDPEALDALLSSSRAEALTVTFSFGQYRVAASSDGRIDIHHR